MNWSDERAALAEQVVDMAVRHRLDSRQIAQILDQDLKVIKRIFHAWSVLGVQFPISHTARERPHQPSPATSSEASV